VKHFASPKFWDAYETFPLSVRKLADANYALLKRDPRHPSLQFKKVGRYWSVRIGLGYRALAMEVDGGYLRFWVGSHRSRVLRGDRVHDRIAIVFWYRSNSKLPGEGTLLLAESCPIP
jgi:hypothetical protein